MIECLRSRKEVTKMFTTNLLAANWYADFLKHVPDSKLFSLRAVLDAFPAVIGKLPVTILLALGGAFFGIVFAMIFALVKINRVRILYPIQAVFVSFLRGTPLLVQLMLTYYGIPLILKAINQSYGTAFNIKRQEVNLSDVFKHLNSEDKQLYRKYYSGSRIDGFVLLDVEYVLSNNKENISVIDLENCLYDDVRPYINTYAKVFGESFVSGFAHASNMKYDDFILSDMEEYLHIKQKVEEIKNK